jgi:hypothetical protein
LATEISPKQAQNSRQHHFRPDIHAECLAQLGDTHHSVRYDKEPLIPVRRAQSGEGSREMRERPDIGPESF